MRIPRILYGISRNLLVIPGDRGQILLEVVVIQRCGVVGALYNRRFPEVAQGILLLGREVGARPLRCIHFSDLGKVLGGNSLENLLA